MTEAEVNPITEASNSLVTLLQRKDVLKKELKDLDEQIEKIDTDLQETMMSQGITKFTTEAGTFYINHATYGSVVNPELAFAYLRDIGAGGLIKETVNSQSLSSTLKELLENGELILDNLEPNGINLYIKKSVRVRGREKM